MAERKACPCHHLTAQKGSVVACFRAMQSKTRTVGTNTQVDLLFERIGLESLSNTKNGILKYPIASALALAIAFLDVKSHSRLTGGPWGTFDQAEACLAPMTVRKLTSRATAVRLATRRVESIVKDGRGIGDGKEGDKS